MIFGEMRLRIRHRLHDIRLTIGENLGKKSQPGNLPLSGFEPGPTHFTVRCAYHYSTAVNWTWVMYSNSFDFRLTFLRIRIKKCSAFQAILVILVTYFNQFVTKIYTVPKCLLVALVIHLIGIWDEFNFVFCRRIHIDFNFICCSPVFNNVKLVLQGSIYLSMCKVVIYHFSFLYIIQSSTNNLAWGVAFLFKSYNNFQ